MIDPKQLSCFHSENLKILAFLQMARTALSHVDLKMIKELQYQNRNSNPLKFIFIFDENLFEKLHFSRSVPLFRPPR